MDRHGTTRSYRKGCRCESCKTVYVNAQRAGKEKRKAALAADPGAFTHGLTAYRHVGCRCEVCKAAQAARFREEKKARGERPFSEVPHGTAGGYKNWGCRCDACTAANSAWTAEYKARRKEAAR